MKRPLPDECAPSYRGYVDHVPEEDVVAVLRAQSDPLRRFAAGIPRERETFAYAPGKWTIREVLGHLGDGERVFGFRAFWFARGDESALPGFDENAYVERSCFNDVSLADLADEFALNRAANLRVLERLDEATWSNSGVASGNAITVRALAFVMAGHVRHHARVLRERYGVDVGV